MPQSSRESKPSLHDLSRQMPTAAEFQRTIDEIDQMEARVAVLIMASMIDNFLERAIEARFVALSPRKFKRLFRDPSAPLGDLASKTIVGYAMGLYGDEFRAQLDRFRTIRNTFAHATMHIDFEHPVINAECMKLDPRKLVDNPYEPERDDARERFTTVGWSIGLHLLSQMNLESSAVGLGAAKAIAR